MKAIFDDISSILITRLAELTATRETSMTGSAAGNRRRFRIDAAAWSAIALRCLNTGHEFVLSAQRTIARNQMDNGCVPLIPHRPEAAWTTPLAVMAWHAAESFEKNRRRAVQFLLARSGEHWESGMETEGHDTSLKGWPWIYGTHSWVEPTAMTVMALSVAGHESHPRVTEAVKMIMDRQLAGGGWNYGNTKVLGSELFPMPESTGMALSALSGAVPRNEVENSIQYLQQKLAELSSPISVGWSLMGLNTWGIKTEQKQGIIQNCLERQDQFSLYSIYELSLLLTAAATPNGLVETLKKRTHTL